MSSSIAPDELEDVVHGTMNRILKVFCEGFDHWWQRIPEPRRKDLLDQAQRESEHFTVGARGQIERAVRDAAPICHLLSVVASDFGMDEFDAKRVRQYRNKLAHREKTPSGRLIYMQLDDVEECVDAVLSLVHKFRAEPQYVQLQHLSEYVVDLLTGGVPSLVPGTPTASAPPVTEAPVAPRDDRPVRPEVKRPPRLEDPPFQLPPKRTKAASRITVIELERLSPDQRDAVERALDWFRLPGSGTGKPFAITGPAGSGKSTVLSAIIERTRLQPDAVMLVAPTGKAVQAIKAKLPRGWRSRARTVASFLWNHKMNGYRGEDIVFVNTGPKPVDPKIRLVIVDEASMVTVQDRDRLREYGRVLFIGDADQLPPVVADEASEATHGSGGVLDAPDAVLRTVHRQDADSAVLQVANAVRSGQQPENGVSPDGHVIVLSEEAGQLGVEQFDELIARSDVVLSQRNSTRVALNEYVRWKRGFMRHPLDFIPKKDEILVASENFQHPVSKCRVSNGERLIVEAFVGTRQMRDDQPELLEFVVRAHPEGRREDSQDWVVSSQMLAGDQIRGSVLMTESVSGPRSGVLRADWGYALTVHKAQGSEWPHVLVVDDHNPDHAIPQNKWYYVAYSRASAQLAVVRVKRDTLLFTLEWGRR